MTYVLVIHKVEDFDKWKSVYDEDGATRKDKGSKGAFVFRNANAKAGVTGQPDVYYLEEIERTPY
jgi:hypothetical protein